MYKNPIISFKNVLPEDWILATRSAKWLYNHPDQKDIILKYENGVTLWVERTKVGNIIVKGPTLNRVIKEKT